MLNRANLNILEDFLFHGGECFAEPSEKTYSERLQEADSKIFAFFEKRYPDITAFDFQTADKSILRFSGQAKIS